MSEIKIEKVNNDNYFSWRRTPWDERVFQKKTLELTDIVYNEETFLNEIFDKINNVIKSDNIELMYFRYNSSDQLIKRQAFLRGFQIVEHSYYVEHSNISKIGKSNRDLYFRKPMEEDIESITKIVEESFHHGRFHEDPFIDLYLARKRYVQWIPQLLKETNFYVLEHNGEVAGFFNYVVKGNMIDLPLSGLSSKYSGLGGFMWKDMFAMISKMEDVKKAKIMISASNLPVINLYISLGFKITNSIFGYHKHVRSK